MGLAPWDGRTKQPVYEWCGSSAESVSLGQDFFHQVSLMTGNPFHDPVHNEEGLHINWDTIENLSHPNQWGNDKFGYYANLAANVQENLESTALALIKSLKEHSQQKNLALVGGVALNSVLNGRIRQESGFDQVFIPPAPGDEGIAVGCALYGLQVSNVNNV
jgi:predicted NodU family carbamoyl transferase